MDYSAAGAPLDASGIACVAVDPSYTCNDSPNFYSAGLSSGAWSVGDTATWTYSSGYASLQALQPLLITQTTDSCMNAVSSPYVICHQLKAYPNEYKVLTDWQGTLSNAVVSLF